MGEYILWPMSSIRVAFAMLLVGAQLALAQQPTKPLTSPGAATTSGVVDVIPTRETIRDTLLSQRPVFRNLMVKFRYHSRLLGTAENARRYFGVKYPTDQQEVYAIKGNKRFWQYQRTASLDDRHTTVAPLVKDQGDRTLTTDANFVVAFNGTQLTRRDPGGHTFSVIDLTSVKNEGHYFKSRYLDMLGQRPPDVLVAAASTFPSLIDVLETGECSIRPQLEDIDGAPCVVIDWHSPLHKAAWCDPQLGYAVRQRVTYEKDADLITWRFAMSDFVELRPGIWLPRKASEIRSPDSKAPEELRGVPLFAYDCDVESISLDDIADELFDLKFTAGAIVSDFAKGADDPQTGQRVAKSFRATADGNIVELPAQKRVDTDALRHDRSRFGFWLILLQVIAVAIVGAGCWYRSRRTGSPR